MATLPILLLAFQRAVAESVISTATLMVQVETDKTLLQALHLFSLEIFRQVMQAAPFTTRTGVKRRACSDFAIFSARERLSFSWWKVG